MQFGFSAFKPKNSRKNGNCAVYWVSFLQSFGIGIELPAKNVKTTMYSAASVRGGNRQEPFTTASLFGEVHCQGTEPY